MAGYIGTSVRNDDLEQGAGQSEAERRDLVTSVKGTIVTYDAGTQTATVKPAYRQKIGDTTLDAPDLLKVPVKHPRGGGYAVHFPLKPGNAVTLSAMMRPLDAWQPDGGRDDGAPGRMHDWSNMIAVPGGEPDNKALPAAVTSGFWSGSDDGKKGVSVDDGGKVALRGGPDGSDKLVVTPAGKVDMQAAGKSLMGIIRAHLAIHKTHLEHFRDHTHAGPTHQFVAQCNALIGQIDALIADIDAMKA